MGETMVYRQIKRIFISIILLIGLIVNFIPYNNHVHALTSTLMVNGAIAYSEHAGLCSYQGIPADWNGLNIDDGDTSYYNINDDGVGYQQTLWPFQAFASAYQSITSVTLYTKVKYTLSTTSMAGVVRINGSSFTGSGYNPTASYVLYSTTWTTNPATGHEWGWSGETVGINTINDAIWGVYGSKSGTAIRNTYMYLVVDYVPQAVPTVTTQAANNIIYSGGSHYALLNGNITSNGGSVLDIRGFAYGLTSVVANPGNVAPPASGYSTNASSYSALTGAYTENITGMAANTRYYVRAFAHNAIGWAYGDEVNFITLGTPTISLLPATLVGSTTARLNSQVTFDGNSSTCNVSFGYGLISHPGAGGFASYTTITAVSGTYATGTFPLLNVTSLVAGSTYYYNVKIQNSYSTAVGTEGTFTTSSGINEPTNFTAIPSATSISLIWTKGSGSVYTLVRYSNGTYPTATNMGMLAVLSLGGSYTVTGLLPGVTYYFSAWGMTGGIYSAAYTTVMCTTLASDAVTPPTTANTTINTSWTLTPSETNVDKLPLIPIFVNWAATVFNQPVNYLWYFLWIMFGVGFGILFYHFSDGKLFVATIFEILWLGFGAAVGLVMLWIGVVFAIIATGLAFFGDRR